MSLHLIPVPLGEAKAFIEVSHRHLGPPRGHKFSLGAADPTGVLVAVAVVGRPVARGLDDGGPAPQELGTERDFISLTDLRTTIAGGES